MIRRVGQYGVRIAQAALLACVMIPTPLTAHEVPARVVVQAFVHADASAVRILVRVPLAAMRDVEFPVRGDGGFLDLARADSSLRDAARLWVADAIVLSADGVTQPLSRIAAVRAALPSAHSFDEYVDALRVVLGPPLPSETEIVAAQAMLDVLLDYPPSHAESRLAVQLRFGHLGVKTTTVVRYITPTSGTRVFMYDGDQTLLRLEPGWWHAAGRFVVMGFEHLTFGIDHVLFLLCLVLPVRRLRPLIGIVTAFTVAHSITLVASVVGYAPDALWFPSLVEVLIAASIVYMAIENVIGRNVERRWLVAFGFGLVHGLGFSYALRESLQFAGGHLALALAAFNVGLELAQLCLLALAVPVISWLFSKLPAERPAVLGVSVLVAHTAWHWMTERFAVFRAYDLSRPTFDIPWALTMVRMATVIFVAIVAARLLSGVMDRLARVRSGASALAIFGLALLAIGTVSPVAAQTATKVAVRSSMTGVYTADQAVKGKEVFAGNCSGCHTVASHSGPAFSVRWMGRPLSEFYEYVSRLMPKSTPGALSEDEYVWVTAYVLRLNNMPAGTRELSADPAFLKSIRIDSTATKAGSAKSGGAGSRE